MADFDIRDHIDALIPAKGKNRYECPSCGGHNFTINPRNGAYHCWSDDSCTPEIIRNIVAPLDLSDRDRFKKIIDSASSRRKARAKEEADKAREQKASTDALDFSAIEGEFNRKWGRLKLEPRDYASLVKRGLDDAAIVRGGFRSDGNRMMCPAFWDGKIIGFQWRSTNNPNLKYYWETGKAHLPNGELPITVLGQTTDGTANIVEGILKPFVVQHKRGGLWFGASGGIFPERIFAKAIEAQGVKRAIIWLDSDGGNLGPAKKLIALAERLEAMGISVTVAYWGQLDGGNLDGDELPLDTPIEYLPIDIIKKKVELLQRVKRITNKTKNCYKLNEKRLPETLWEIIPDLGHKLICVSSAKKTGKTRSIISPLIKSLRDEGSRVLALFNRVSLALDSCRDWGIDFRDDVDMEGIDGSGDGFALGQVIDSLMKLKDSTWDVVILDEVSTLLKHLYTSDTAVKNRRSEIIAQLQRILRGAKLILASDADLSSDDINHLESMADLKKGDGYLILNEGRPDEGQEIILFSGNPGTLRESFLDRIGRGDRVIFFADSKTEVEALDKICKSMGVTSVVWSRDTSGTDEVKAQMKNPDEWLKVSPPQVLLISPTAQVGVSITEECFDMRLAYSAGVIEPSAFRQLMARYRPHIYTEVWAARMGNINHNFSKSIYPESVKRSIVLGATDGLRLDDLAKAIAFDITQSDVDAGDDVDAPNYIDMLAIWKEQNWANCSHLNKTSRIIAEMNWASKNNYDLLKAELTDEGYLLYELDGEPTSANDAVKIAKEEIQWEVADMRFKGFGNLDISLTQAKFALEDKSTGREEREQSLGVLLRDEILPGFDCDLNWILENWVTKPRYLGQCKLGYFLERPEIAELIDGSRVKSKLGQWQKSGIIFAPDLALTGPKIRLLKDLEMGDIFAAESFTTAADDTIIAPWWERVQDKYYLMDRVLGIHVSEKSKPGKILGALLDKIGLSLEKVSRSKSQRFYKVATPSDRGQMFEAWDRKYSKFLGFISGDTSQNLTDLAKSRLVSPEPLKPRNPDGETIPAGDTSRTENHSLIRIETCVTNQNETSKETPLEQQRFSTSSPDPTPTVTPSKPDLTGKFVVTPDGSQGVVTLIYWGPDAKQWIAIISIDGGVRAVHCDQLNEIQQQTPIQPPTPIQEPCEMNQPINESQPTSVPVLPLAPLPPGPVQNKPTQGHINEGDRVEMANGETGTVMRVFPRAIQIKLDKTPWVTVNPFPEDVKVLEPAF